MTRKFPSPPKWPIFLLRKFLRKEYLEEIEGDMEEIFHDLRSQYSPLKTNTLFLWEVLLLFRINLIRQFKIMQWLGNIGIFKSYLKSGWRNFLRYKSYGFINIFGLTIGFSATLLLFLIVRYENSFDQFHSNASDIYRVGDKNSEGEISDLIVTPQIPLMVSEYADIVRGSRFMEWEDIFEFDGSFARSSYHYVDSSFARMFDFEVLEGDLDEALSLPDRLVLTESLAKKIFAGAPALGQEIRMVNEDRILQVGAILKDAVRNSSLQFSALIPWLSAPELLNVDQMGNWYNTFMTGYVELAKGSEKSVVEKKLTAFKERHFLPERVENSDIMLLPLTDEHFRLTGNVQMIYILSGIAIALLLISCFNFINLSISQLLERTREMGIRKVMGGFKTQLTFQFITESLVICGFALLASFLLTYILLPVVGHYFDFGLAVDSLNDFSTLIFLLGTCLGIAIISNLWPTLSLAGLSSIRLMKDSVHWSKSGGLFRRTLLVVQFAISIGAIIGSILIWKQINFMKDQDLKFDGNAVISLEFYPELFRNSDDLSGKVKLLKEELLANPAIEALAMTNGIPGDYSENYNYFESLDSSDIRGSSLRQLTVDDDFFSTFKMNILEGRDFDFDVDQNNNAVIINESAYKFYGWNNLEEKYLKPGGNDHRFKVVGVVQDYYYQSLKDQIQPLIHFYSPTPFGKIAIRLNSESIERGLNILEDKWNDLQPYEPLHYTFVDDSFDLLYREQQKLGSTSVFFAGIVVMLAGLGLFSLSAYSIRLRRREIGIRKVLGASVFDIVTILSRNYGMLIMLGFVIACPLVYYLIDLFLQDFAYHIPLSPGVFLLGGSLLIFSFIMMVALQSFRAASQNPSAAIKDE